jgi:cell fate (sporulation/competence/biofilm development) regulator YlbF (YheA/YmcA/DUF963 family)
VSRAAVDRMAKREFDHAQQSGKPISYEKAREKARETAHKAEVDRAGMTKNYRDGER